MLITPTYISLLTASPLVVTKFKKVWVTGGIGECR